MAEDLAERLKRSRNYLNAARERMDAATRLYGLGDNAGAIYFAGVATECIFHSFFVLNQRLNDARHQLELMSIRSGFERLMSPLVLSPELRAKADEYSAYLTDLWRWWRNDIRYLSERELDQRYAGMRDYLLFKGERLKEAARRSTTAATKIVELGVLQWKS